jgi:hypothetical protein
MDIKCNKRCPKGSILKGRTNKCVKRNKNRELSACQQNKISNVMREYKDNNLNIGKTDKKVTSREQAIAIAIRSACKACI